MDKALVFATVGTDHHPFHRLIDWIDEYVEAYGDRVDVVVQYGFSRAPRAKGVRAFQLVGFDELQDLMRKADVLVTPGPNTIMEAREYGLRGLYLPRDPALGEHVDAHQLVFADHCEAAGLFDVIRTREALFGAIDLASKDRDAYRFDVSALPKPIGITRIAEAIDALVWGTERPW